MPGRGPECGLSLCRMIEVFAEPQDDPWYAPHIRFFARAPAADIPAGYADALHVELPLYHPARYMPCLLERYRALGGEIQQREIASFAEVSAPGRLLVNCSGVWSRQLANDEAVFPLRGHTVVVEALPVANYLDESNINRIVHIFHRGEDIILGGLAQEENWDLTPHPAIARPSCSGPWRSPRNCATPASSPSRSACAPAAMSCAWSARISPMAGPSSTITATAAPASPSPGAAPRKWSTWRASGWPASAFPETAL